MTHAVLMRRFSGEKSGKDDDFIFVYGTLQKAAETTMHKVLAQYSRFYSNGYMHGKLYDVNGYPGVIESLYPNDKVYGEVYKIEGDETILSALDDYEECSDRYQQPHEYERKKLIITLPCGGNIVAWTYVYKLEVLHLMQIKSGNYLDAIKASKQD